MHKKLSPEILKALASFHYAAHGEQIAAILNEQLPPDIYKKIKTIFAAFQGCWDKKSGAHLFPCDPQPHIRHILGTGIMPEINPLEFFPTPEKLATGLFNTDFIKDQCDRINYQRREGTPVRMLEPSAGSGALADHAARLLADGKQAVACVELDPQHCKTLARKNYDVIGTDFLKWEPGEKFPLIVMNPPFGNNAWQKHLRHAFDLLTHDGKLVCITPANLPDDPEFLQWLAEHGEFEENPSDAFKPSGTSIRTGTIFIDKACHAALQRRRETGSPDLDNFLLHIDNDRAFWKTKTDAFRQISASLIAHDATHQSAAWEQAVKTFGETCDQLALALLKTWLIPCRLTAKDHAGIFHGLWLEKLEDAGRPKTMQDSNIHSREKALDQQLLVFADHTDAGPRPLIGRH
ncbi:class I SAM-dependent methyltransferase [Termitidicoccus mucosus]|uniref:Uncharacterized protein n=1 Tax=Termitidicoccus mucosus TaxID=1184151 RepID=A0A178IR01_9BACT|nr:hypothetical protein AW736_01795 [Opitutaceae bacterium TSB47]